MGVRDSWLFPYRAFDVRGFLKRISSPRLADTPQFADWIDEAARASDIRSEWLLKLAQKEQSFLSRKKGGSGWQRALDYTMGYGALEGGTDLPEFKGVQTQVFAAARGIRGYLTRGSKFDVTDWPGTRMTFDGITGTVANLAAAVCLRYTPHWSTLQTVERLWEQFGFDDGGGETMKRQSDVAGIAEEVLRRARAGEKNFSINGVPFEADDVAYCAEFVRECHAAVTGEMWPPWSSHACWMERNLHRQGYRIEQPTRGCIVAFCADKYAKFGRDRVWNASEAWLRANNAWGHVAIYVGDDRIIENSNGFGTRTLDQVGRSRISGYYAPLPIEAPELRETLVVLMDPAEEFGIPLEVMRHEDGRLFVEARAAFEATGYGVHAEHLATKQRVYVKPTAETVATARRIAGTGGE